MSKETGNQLRKLRKEHGLSQEKFAHEIGVSRQIVSRWEKGKVIPNVGSVKKICDYYKINSDLFIYTENPAGEVESHPVAKIRPKTIIKGIAIFLLLLFILYVVYSLYKFFLLKDLEKKFKEYDNWTNYYAEIRTLEEARLTSKEKIWYRDNKYKIVTENYYEDGKQSERIMWIDCNKNEIIESTESGNIKLERQIINNNRFFINGKYIKNYFYWINIVERPNILYLSFMPNIIAVVNGEESVRINNKKLTLEKGSAIPVSYTDSINDTVIVRYYKIELGAVKQKDLEINKDL